ncbi:hypothetical protein, partial [Cronobacter sakazakii]|uniref:hypothetical protein n=1 Tax=Cronobacter sakazakii TaxID=28141 RepID=UPI001FF03B29
GDSPSEQRYRNLLTGKLATIPALFASHGGQQCTFSSYCTPGVNPCFIKECLPMFFIHTALFPPPLR